MNTSKKMKWIYNAFEFLEVWLPYGRECIIYDLKTGSQEITKNELRKESNNESLAGIDITIFHPEGLAVNSANFKKVVIGTVIGNTREKNGVFEVKCLIKDSKTIDLIKSGVLTETSAVYISDGKGNRLYNSIAIVPNGYAKLGRTMTLKAEAKQQYMNPEDLKAIAEAVAAEFKVTEAEVSEFEKQKSMLKAEAYAEGLNEGKEVGRKEADILSSAKNVGYEGEDASLAGNFLIDNQFPGLRAESMDLSDIMLLVQAAMKSSSCKTCSDNAEVEIEAESKKMLMAESLPETTVDYEATASIKRKQLPRRAV